MTNQAKREAIVKNGITRDGMIGLAVNHSFTDPDIERRVWMFLADCLAHTVSRYNRKYNIWEAEDMVDRMRARAQGKCSDHDVMRWASTLLESMVNLGHHTSQYITSLAAHMGMWNLFKDRWAAETIHVILNRCAEVEDKEEAMKGAEESGPRRSYGDIVGEMCRWQEARLRAWLSDDEPTPFPTTPEINRASALTNPIYTTICTWGDAR